MVIEHLNTELHGEGIVSVIFIYVLLIMICKCAWKNDFLYDLRKIADILKYQMVIPKKKG